MVLICQKIIFEKHNFFVRNLLRKIDERTFRRDKFETFSSIHVHKK